MNRALATLLMLNQKAVLRRALRGLKTWRGALLLVVTLAFFALMLGPQIFMSLTLGDRPEARQVTGAIQPVASLALLGFTLLFVFTSGGETAVYFTPAEVDLLFAAPFSRRELLLYKLAKTAIALLFVSAFLVLAMLVNFRWWLSAYVGLVLALGMVQLMGMIATLAGQIVAESVYTRARRAVLAVVAIVALAGVAQAAGTAQAMGLSGVLSAMRESTALRVLLSPFEVFTRAMYAERGFPDLVGWGAAALAIDAALVAIVLVLDANYLEVASAVSQKVYERVRRAKQGGGVAMPVGARAGRLRLAELPWLAGVGPIAWRQMLIVLRTSRHLLITSTVALAFMVGGLLFSAPTAAGSAASSVVPGSGIAMIFYLTSLFSMQLPWAFRGDLDHLEVLKTLPIRPASLAIGELAGGVLVLSAVQLGLFGLLAAAAPGGWSTILVAAAFCPTFNGLMLGMNNFLFLLYPVRHPAGTTLDIQMMGKSMIFFIVQFAALAVLAGIAAAVGGIAYFLSGFSWAAFVATSWLVLTAEFPPLVMAVAWAFERFDVSTQTPA